MMGVSWYFVMVDDEKKRVNVFYVGKGYDEFWDDNVFRDVLQRFSEVDDIVEDLEMSMDVSVKDFTIGQLLKFFELYSKIRDIKYGDIGYDMVSLLRVFGLWMIADYNGYKWRIVNDFMLSDELKEFQNNGYDVWFW